MMPIVLGANVPETFPSSTCTNHPIVGDIARQTVHLDPSRRIPRPSNASKGHSAMRVAKPRSANNSPQSTIARHRMWVDDPHIARRRQQALDQALLHQMENMSSTCHASQLEPAKKTNRPLSWHSSGYLRESQRMQVQMPQPEVSQFNMAMPIPCQPPNLPPTPAAYSGHTSPVASYSPLTLPCAAVTPLPATPGYAPADQWMAAPQMALGCSNPKGSSDSSERSLVYSNQASFINWNAYAPYGFQTCTAPPTPEEFHYLQQPQTVPSEESIPYDPLDKPEEEEEGEILVGMGLYDLPSKTYTDPRLDHHRTTTSQLWDTTYSNGKGWKLEEAWEPPTTDEEDSEEDADADEQGVELKNMQSRTA
ncbi:hypothetical protein F5Y17DRAFT_455163 [Xylariaceae sp. FL0594]|nr:hypothetical protein F5Y17DRAFT_455163 [Xylariaceae sp. FL0594]